jgi:hypothetical protein
MLFWRAYRPGRVCAQDAERNESQFLIDSGAAPASAPRFCIASDRGRHRFGCHSYLTVAGNPSSSKKRCSSLTTRSGAESMATCPWPGRIAISAVVSVASSTRVMSPAHAGLVASSNNSTGAPTPAARPRRLAVVSASASRGSVAATIGRTSCAPGGALVLIELHSRQTDDLGNEAEHRGPSSHRIPGQWHARPTLEGRPEVRAVRRAQFAGTGLRELPPRVSRSCRSCGRRHQSGHLVLLPGGWRPLRCRQIPC